MFTLSQIKEAHSKVKSGADFPMYIKEIKDLGVIAFETWVNNSHTEYFGNNGFSTKSEPMYDALAIAEQSNKTIFETRLKMHQQGRTDYFTFCKDCAETGIERWFADLNEMTCVYFDLAGNKILGEKIPG